MGIIYELNKLAESMNDKDFDLSASRLIQCYTGKARYEGRKEKNRLQPKNTSKKKIA
jgi:hypothetical protein